MDISRDDLIFFIHKNYGLKTRICKDLSISLKELNRLIEEQDLSDAFIYAKEQVLDDIEEFVIDKAKSDLNTAKWYLERVRGSKFSDKHKVELEQRIQVYLPKPVNEILKASKELEEADNELKE